MYMVWERGIDVSFFSFCQIQTVTSNWSLLVKRARERKIWILWDHLKVRKHCHDFHLRRFNTNRGSEKLWNQRVLVQQYSRLSMLLHLGSDKWKGGWPNSESQSAVEGLRTGGILKEAWNCTGGLCFYY